MSNSRNAAAHAAAFTYDGNMRADDGKPNERGKTMVEIKLQGKTVAKSQNLRGILGYARKHPVVRASVHKMEGGARFFITFNNGAECGGTFADFSVCVGWFLSRRSWGLYGVRNSDRYWTFIE